MSRDREAERRTLRRVLTRITATFESGKLSGDGYVKNVSKRGLFLRSDVLPPVGSSIRIRLSIKGGAQVEVTGTVLWTTEQLETEETPKAGFGIEIPLDDQGFVEFFERILFS